MWHDDGPYDTHSLQQSLVVAPRAARHKQALENGQLVGLGHPIFIAKGDGHDGDQEGEECLQFAESIAIQAKEGEGVHDSD